MNCSICPLGFKCPSLGLNTPTQCSVGEYQDEKGMSSCKDCIAGKYCNDTKSSGVLCQPGLYSLGKSSVCVTCPAGYRYVLYISGLMFYWNLSLPEVSSWNWFFFYTLHEVRGP